MDADGNIVSFVLSLLLLSSLECRQLQLEEVCRWHLEMVFKSHSVVLKVYIRFWKYEMPVQWKGGLFGSIERNNKFVEPFWKRFISFAHQTTESFIFGWKIDDSVSLKCYMGYNRDLPVCGYSLIENTFIYVSQTYT